MKLLSRRHDPSRPKRGQLVAWALMVGAAAVGVSGLAVAVMLLAAIWRAPDGGPPDEALVRGVMSVGVVFGLLLAWGAALTLWALSEGLRRLERIEQIAQQPPPPAVAPPPPAEPVAPVAAASSASPMGFDAQPLLDVLREIRDLSLLNDEQRAQRLEYQADEWSARLRREIPQLLRQHNWSAAHQELAVARARFPHRSEWDALAQEVEQTQHSVEQRDVETVSRQVQDLVALGAWDRALDAVGDLLRRHPDSKAADELSRNLHQQRVTALAHERRRLMDEAQNAVHQRQWRRAVRLAEGLIDRFPKSAEAEALRQQLPTLRENAEIQARQEMETQIRDLIRQQRFSAALELARTLIGRYPNSPQAGILRDQLPRLEQRAAQQQSQQPQAG